MNQTSRRLLLAQLALAGLMVIGSGVPISAQETDDGSSGTIEVTGTGEAEAVGVGAVLQFIMWAQLDINMEPASEPKFGSTA